MSLTGVNPHCLLSLLHQLSLLLLLSTAGGLHLPNHYHYHHHRRLTQPLIIRAAQIDVDLEESHWLQDVQVLGGGSHGTVYSGLIRLGDPASRIVVKEATQGFAKADLYLRREVAINARLARVPSLSPHLAPYRGTYNAPSMQCDESTTTTYIVWDFKPGATATLL